MMKDDYHIPVLAKECIEGLSLKEGGVYCDLTFGGGGHSSLILKAMPDSARLFSFDQDKDAAENVLDDKRFQFVPQNFRFLKRSLRLFGVSKVDGILADLGVSSFQFDEASRGFSIRGEGPLDMRMNQAQEMTAKKLIEERTAEELAIVFFKYSDLKNARKVAEKIKANAASLNTTNDLVELLSGMVVPNKRNQFLARVFQALRIEVNDEMAALEEMLVQVKEVLNPGGRLVVMSYHSMEDRLVKNFMRSGNFQGKIEKDFYGQHLVDFKVITRKPVVPEEEEQERNSRSRSAKLRIAERIEHGG